MANVNKAGQTHDQLQAACWAEACQIYHPWLHKRLFAVPNDMHAGNVARWKQYEALGVTPGVWDMCLQWFVAHVTTGLTLRPNNYAVYPATHWFEFKVGSDELSKAQKKFQQTMLPLGHKFYVVTEQHEFMQQIKNIVEPTLEIARQIWGVAEQ